MPTFIIDWFICNSNNYNINSNWYMKLLWPIEERRPKSIMLKRKNSVDCVLVTSNLELVGGCTAQCIKGFQQWLPAGCTYAEIQLEYSISVFRNLQAHALKSCRIRGEITFSENEQTYNDKRVMRKSETKSTAEFYHENFMENTDPLLQLTTDFERL